MKLYRFMSMAEFSKLTAGVPLVSHNSHAGKRTSSHGFCFMAAESRDEAFWNYGFLDGIVSKDVLVEFEADLSLLMESVGTYADPNSDDWFATIDKIEYCTDAYDRDVLRPTAYGIFDYLSCEWYEL